VIKEYIFFSIGFEDMDWGHKQEEANRNAFVKEFTSPFNIKCGFAGQGRVPLDMPYIDIFLDKLKSYADSKKILFSKNCGYVRSYEGDSEWYKFLPSRSIETTEYDGCIMTCKATNIPVDINVGSGFYAYPFVTDKFKKVVDDNNLKGLEFLWCKDVGRFAPAKQWYMAIATEFIGRGLDAPWVDVNSKSLPEYQKFSRDLGRISSNFHIPAKCLYKDAPIPQRLLIYLSMCDIEKFTITFYERFLREYLPKTDFAFGYFPGWQGFYISKRAKDILLQSNLIHEMD